MKCAKCTVTNTLTEAPVDDIFLLSGHFGGFVFYGYEMLHLPKKKRKKKKGENEMIPISLKMTVSASFRENPDLNCLPLGVIKAQFLANEQSKNR